VLENNHVMSWIGVVKSTTGALDRLVVDVVLGNRIGRSKFVDSMKSQSQEGLLSCDCNFQLYQCVSLLTQEDIDQSFCPTYVTKVLIQLIISQYQSHQLKH